jgi:hypothetical protein
VIYRGARLGHLRTGRRTGRELGMEAEEQGSSVRNRIYQLSDDGREESMKRVIVSFIAGAVFATAGIGAAVTTRHVPLRTGDHVTWHGVDCNADPYGYGTLDCHSRWQYSVVYGTRELQLYRGKKLIFHRDHR